MVRLVPVLHYRLRRCLVEQREHRAKGKTLKQQDEKNQG
jgi:hypothetical protein